MDTEVRIAIIDDHPMLCDGLEQTLCSVGDFHLVARGASADDAMRIAETQSPDLMLLDVNMPGDGVAATQAILRRFPDIKILILSALDDEHHVTRALQAGAAGYLVKGVSGDELIETARRVHRGESYVSPGLAARLLAERRSVQAPTVVELSEREAQILQRLALGMSNLEIGKQIGLSEKTIKHYMTGLMRKLGAKHRLEAALIGRRLYQEHALQ